MRASSRLRAIASTPRLSSLFLVVSSSLFPSLQLAGEVFRAATKLYYDFHNNAMVNNTSGAINYLVEAGVLPRQSSSSSTSSFLGVAPPPPPPPPPSIVDVDDANNNAGRAVVDDAGRADIFDTIYPYAIGARVHLGDPREGARLAAAVEELLDATIAHLRDDPRLDLVPNASDYHDRRDPDVRPCLERCAIRNRLAAEMHARTRMMGNDATWTMKTTATTKTTKTRGRRTNEVNGRETTAGTTARCDRRAVIAAVGQDSTNADPATRTKQRKKRMNKKNRAATLCKTSCNEEDVVIVVAELSKLDLFA